MGLRRFFLSKKFKGVSKIVLRILKTIADMLVHSKRGYYGVAGGEPLELPLRFAGVRGCTA
jgi:hypothetical protein